jgi:probable H4MPT-linked C1 transfer pathway protein
VRGASAARPIHVWSTDGVFLNSEEAKQNHMKVASANWHALATFAGRYVPQGYAILVDVGSTTTDVIPILDGVPVPGGETDSERMGTSELIYTGARRTPVCVLLRSTVMAEVFATTLDAYLLLGKIAEAPDDRDTADGRPATRACAHARMARMVGGDSETVKLAKAIFLAEEVQNEQRRLINYGIDCAIGRIERLMRHRKWTTPLRFILAGSGEFLVRDILIQRQFDLNNVYSLTDEFGGTLSTCAPAYAVAVLATERRK